MSVLWVDDAVIRGDQYSFVTTWNAGGEAGAATVVREGDGPSTG